MSTEDYLKYEVFGEDYASIEKDTLYRPNLNKLGEEPKETLLKNEEGFAEYEMDFLSIPRTYYVIS